MLLSQALQGNSRTAVVATWGSRERLSTCGGHGLFAIWRLLRIHVDHSLFFPASFFHFIHDPNLQELNEKVGPCKERRG